MTDGDDKLELTRRKILGAAGAVGVAGAGAGMGTSALFSDVESFVNNQITAGTLNLSVDAEIVEASGYWEDQGIIGDMASVDGDPVVGLQAEDVKPGDWIIICFDITVEDNPGYVRISADDFAQYENGQTEPEEDVDSTGGGSLGGSLDGQGDGELQDELVAEVYEDYDDSIDGPNETTAPPRDYLSSEEPSLSGSAKAAFEQFATGVVLGGGATPTEVDGSVKRYLLLELPADVGNEVQSDAIEFDLVFDALQVRNNDGFEPSSNLAGYWPLNDVGTGPVEDSSGNSNDGTAQGDVSATSGKVAGAGSFDGDGDYVEISDDPILDLTDAFSIAAWVNTSQDQDPYARLVSREQSGAGNRQYNLGFTPGGERARTIVDTTSTNSIEVVGTTDLTDGSWHHVVVTCDVAATSLRLYVDNSEEDDETINDPVVSRASDVVLGAVAHTPSNLPYEGAIDDVRIYDRALSSSEVTALYNNTNL